MFPFAPPTPIQLVSFSALLLLAALALLLAAPAFADPALAPREWQTRVNEVMYGMRDQQALSTFLGKEADKCLPSRNDSELCEWVLSKENAGWRPLAKAIDTREPVSLICLVPADPSLSTPNACSARPQNSNRRMFSPMQYKRDLKRKLNKLNSQVKIEFNRRKTSDPAIREKLRPIAMSWLNAARNLEEMSRLLGALPDRCKAIGSDEQVCMWRTSFTTYGHGTVAAAVPVAGRKKVDLICRLPVDGSFRRSGESCEFKPEI